MKKNLFILLAVICIHIDLAAQPAIKSVKIGEKWIEYAVTHLEIEYYYSSNLLLIKDSALKSNYPLKDTISAESFVEDIKDIRNKSHLAKGSKAKAQKEFVLNVVDKKEHLTEGCFYVEFTNGKCVYLGRKSSQSDWFMYWDGKIYSVEKECAELFKERYSAISIKKIQDNIKKADEEFHKDLPHLY